MIALDPTEEGGSFDFVLQADRELPENEQTVWVLRPLTQGEWAQILDAILVTDEGNRAGGVASTALAVLRRGLVAVKNLLDSSKQAIDLEGVDLSSDEFLSRIPWAARIELASAIEGRTVLSEGDVEKSGPSPTE